MSLQNVPDSIKRDVARGVALLKEAGCQQVYVFGFYLIATCIPPLNEGECP